MHKPEHCCKSNFRQLWVIFVVVVVGSGGWRLLGSPWSASTFPLAKVTEAKLCQLLKHSVYRIIPVIITVLSVISTDFSLSQWTSSQSLTVLWRSSLWQRVMQGLLTVLSMNSSSCPWGNGMCGSSLKASIVMQCPVMAKRWVVGPGRVWVVLTRVPEQLHGDAHPAPLSPGHAPQVLVPHPGVGALPQAELCYHIFHLRGAKGDRRQAAVHLHIRAQIKLKMRFRWLKFIWIFQCYRHLETNLDFRGNIKRDWAIKNLVRLSASLMLSLDCHFLWALEQLLVSILKDEKGL